MNPEVFFIIWLVIVITISTIFFIHSKKALNIFPEIYTVNVIYRDTSASGRSLKSFKTRFGGATKVLDIVVISDQELWLKSQLEGMSLIVSTTILNQISGDLRRVKNQVIEKF